MTKVAKMMITAMICGMMMAGCGGGGSSPKSLAKQCAEMAVEAEKLQNESNVSKFNAFAKKSEALSAKVEKLSKEDREIYDAECTRLIEKAKK